MRIGLIAVMSALALAHASEATYSEWAAQTIDAILTGELEVKSDARYFWHGQPNDTWSAGVAFVRSQAFGDGILVVPDSALGPAYLAFRKHGRYVTKSEAHELGFGFCPFLTTTAAATVIELEPDTDTWVPAE